MAGQSYIQVPTDGSGKKLDTQVTTTAAQHRQVMVIGAKDTDANIAPVDATTGLKVNLGADNDVTLATLPDTASGDLASIAADLGTIDTDTGNISTYASRLLSSAAGIDPATAAATTSFVTSGQYDSTQKTLTDGQQASWAMSARGAMIVNPGAETFTVDTGLTKGAGAADASTLLVTIDSGQVSNAVTSQGSFSDGVAQVGLPDDHPPIPVDHSTTGIGHGTKTVTTAGTDVVLASSTAAKWVIIQAIVENTDNIAVGASGVDATDTTGTGVVLTPGDSITIPCDNLADIFIDSIVNGEGVRYTYGT